MLDMIRPTVTGKISLSDMKRCQMAPIFFDTFFNLEKYLDHEQRDPFASQRDPDSESGDDTAKVLKKKTNKKMHQLKINNVLLLLLTLTNIFLPKLKFHALRTSRNWFEKFSRDTATIVDQHKIDTRS